MHQERAASGIYESSDGVTSGPELDAVTGEQSGGAELSAEDLGFQVEDLDGLSREAREKVAKLQGELFALMRNGSMDRGERARAIQALSRQIAIIEKRLAN